MVPYATLKMVGLPCRLVSLAVAMAATGSPVAMSKDVGPRMLPAASAGVNVVHVSPGHLHRCAAAAAAAQRAADTSGGGRVATTRCVLSAGTYRDEHVEFTSGGAPLEIVGAGGPDGTVLRGDVILAGLSWQLSPLHNGSGIYFASLPPGRMRTPGVRQAFIDDEWLPEARYPNTNVHKVLKLTSWGDCGKGSEHGYCKDRPDAWSSLAREHVNWTGALATLSLGGRYATWTRKVSHHGRGWFSYYPASLGPGPGSKGAAKPGGRYFLSVFRPPEPSGPRPTGRATTTRRRRGVLSSARVCQRYSDEQSFTLHCLLEAAIINYTQMDSSEPGQNRRLQHRGILRSPSCSGPRIRAEVPPIVSPGEKWPAAAPPRRLYLLRGAFCGSFLEENLHRRTQDGLEVRSITQLIDYLVAKVPNGRVRTATLPDVPGRNTVVHFIPN
jgi:hypothetical protein